MIHVVITVAIACILLICIYKLFELIYPYTLLTTPEEYNPRYLYYIERYLNAIQANNFNVSLTIPKNHKVTDEFEGFKVWWTKYQDHFLLLTFHKRHHHAVITRYLKHVHTQGRSITFEDSGPAFYFNKDDGEWTRVLFKHHPITFDTLVMDPQKKIGLVNELTRFSKSKDDSDEACMAWIRSYILSGSSRIGKSTMIAAMANLLEYNIYNIRLESVKDNTELEKLLISTSEESIVVIEGIKEIENVKLEEIEWLLSGNGGGRIIVFNMEKLDPDLISERMIKLIDKHIELKEETDMTPSVGRNLKPNMEGGWEYLLVEINGSSLAGK